MKNIKYSLVLLFLVSMSLPASAGFLDMPDISETPDLKRETMLRDLDIPEVRKRNPDPSAGPRLAVSEFRIQGLVEYPKLGITKQAIQELVEKIRFKLMAEDKLLDSGYTLDELGELSDLLVDIEKETVNRHVTPIEVQKLVWLIREQRSKRGITLGQIEAIADQITRFYRERGFILAKAYIPKQQVRDGIVTLTLLLGMLGEVEVSGNKMYKSKLIESAFRDMIAKPVTHESVEERLYLINDFPGLLVDGYFEPGKQVGDTKLNIRVRDEKRFGANLRLDNHGTDETGLYRLYGDFQINNLLGAADILSLSLLRASSPSNTKYWQAYFQTNLFSPRWKLLLDASKNQFVIDQNKILEGVGLGVTGDVFVYDVALEYYLKRGRIKNYKFELRFNEMESDLQIGDIPDVGNRLDEKLQNNSLLFSYDILQERSQLLHTGNARIVSGKYIYGNEVGQDEKYTYLTAEYSLLSFVKIPWTDVNTRVIFRSALQYAGKNLSTIIRAPLGGPTRARAFPINLYSADDGVYLGVDWLFNSPFLRENLTPFLFLDYAWGQQHRIVVGEDKSTAQVADIGFGVQFNVRPGWRGTAQLAFPFGTEFSDPEITSTTGEPRFVFDVQYAFF